MHIMEPHPPLPQKHHVVIVCLLRSIAMLMVIGTVWMSIYIVNFVSLRDCCACCIAQ